jgi:predicted  nucleic acid-binding Zn-ribbon protein
MTENLEPVEQKTTPGWVTAAIVILAIVSIAGVGLAWNATTKLQDMQTAVTGQMKAVQTDFDQKIADLQQKGTQADAATTALQSDLSVVTKRLKLTQGELKTARDETQQIKDEDQKTSEQIADVNTNVSDVKTQLGTKASADDLNATNGNVTAVKTDLAGTKNDLNMARSELGTLIAKNHDEIDELRRMGEREYVEFSVAGRGKPQKVGNVTVELRSVNTKKNQFDVALTVDDVRTDKGNRTVNEPIVYYPHGSHQADEFVVNSVSKDKITGYISTPKNAPATTTAASNGD